MKRPRVTIAGLMIVVGIAALNIALLRAFFVEEMFIGGVLMLLTLQGGLLGLLKSQGRARRFWVGFEITGAIAVIALFSCEFFPNSPLSRLESSYINFVLDLVSRHLPDSTSTLLLDERLELFLAGVYFAPELIAAVLGGLLATWVPGLWKSRGPAPVDALDRAPQASAESIP
jgi:hypothetical protein